MAELSLYDTTAQDIESVVISGLSRLQVPGVARPLFAHGVRGGDYSRPALLGLTYRTLAPSSRLDIRPAMLAVELLHRGTLIDDDIVDHDDYRGQNKTLHHEYNVEQALLMGPYFYGLAFQEINSLIATFDPALVARCTELLSQTLTAISHGQLEDVIYRERPSISTEECLGMTYRRTALFVENVTAIAAILAGVDGRQVEQAKSFGRQLGFVFQLVNDLNNILGVEEAFRRTAGSEIGIGAKVLPLVHHWECLSSDEKEHSLSDPDWAEGNVASVLERTASISFTADVIEEHLAQAGRDIADWPVSSAKEELMNITGNLSDYLRYIRAIV